MKTTIALLVAVASAQMDAPQMTSITFNSDTTYNSTYSKDDTQNKIKEMRKKFTDYFEYALDAKGVDANTTLPTCSTTQECSDGGMLTKCCVSATLHHKVSGTKDAMYRCMTKAVADANVDMQLADFSVSMKCLGSSAAMIGASVATLAAMTLY